MWIKNQHNHLKQQLTAKSKELQIALENPDKCVGFIGLLRDVEYLFLLTEAYGNALNDVKSAFEG